MLRPDRGQRALPAGRSYNPGFSSRESPWKPNASTRSKGPSQTCAAASPNSGGIFDVDAKEARLKEIGIALEDPKVWDDSKRAQELGREKKAAELIVEKMHRLEGGVARRR